MHKLGDQSFLIEEETIFKRTLQIMQHLFYNIHIFSSSHLH